jgi:hypothetical protein
VSDEGTKSVPGQLLERLRRFLDQQPASHIMAIANTPRIDDPLPPPPPPNELNPPAQNVAPHWPAGRFGNPIANVQCIMIHGTSGWPSYAAARGFENRFSSLDQRPRWVPATQNKPAHWEDDRGIGTQYFVEPNGTAFTLIGARDLVGVPRLTWHGPTMNAFALGIENGDIGDTAGIEPGDGVGPRWWRLSNLPDDLTGMKVYILLHPRGDEDAVLIWIARFPDFNGSGDIEDGDTPATDRRLSRHPTWNNMLFTERNYRSLALLSRLIAEQNGLPRNLPLLPYLDNDRDRPDRDLFRKLILSDQLGELIAQKLGTTTAIIQANGAAFAAFYTVASRARIWSRFFGADPQHQGDADRPCFRGFLSHDINGNHHCPGPLFDWHRFAREIWDWWWYPFDFERAVVLTTLRPSLTRRAYMQARRNTPLIEYYYDAIGSAADYNGLHPPLSLTEGFLLPDPATPVYAMANGVVVAARFALSNNPAASGFLLVRHEVFHRGVANRIDYNGAPTFVWSLTRFLGNAGFSIPAAPSALPGPTPTANPSWLNRFIMRLRECELAVAFHTRTFANPAANPAQVNLRAALTHGWAHSPSGAGPRLATGQEIESDATAYRGFADDLLAGRYVLFPLEANPAPTPVRVILGDFLGFPNRMAQNQEGIQVEIFSKDKLEAPGVTRQASSASLEDWWGAASGAIRHEAVVDMDLPADGMAWHYPMTEFLEWVNHITWASEWAKYEVVAEGGGPAVPTRPLTRLVP